MQVHRMIVLPADAARVWTALTDGDRLSIWFGARVELVARRGGRASFEWPDGRSREAVVEVLEPHRLLVLRWLPFERDPQGRTRQRVPGTIRVALEPDPPGTRLRISEERAGSVFAEPGGPVVDPPPHRPTEGLDALALEGISVR